MSRMAVNGTPSGIRAGMAVRMSAPNHVWTGMVTALRPRGRAEVVITDPGDSIHCPGQVVIVAARQLTPLQRGEAGRHQARAQMLLATPPAARRADGREAGEELGQRLIEAIEARGQAASRDMDDAVWYLGERITEAADTIASAIDLAGAPQTPRGWRRRR